MPKPNMSNLAHKTAKFLTQFKKKYHRRASAANTRRFQRKFYLNRIRHTQRADFRRKSFQNMPNELMENEDMGSYMSAPAPGPEPAPAAAAAAEINELREMRRRAQIKRAKEKAEQKAKQAKITAKAKATRATRKAIEEEQAKATKMANASKKLAIKEGRAARADRRAAIRAQFQGRIDAAQAARAAGNVAGADAMEDEIREEIREQEANKGNTGLEDIFKNLGL